VQVWKRRDLELWNAYRLGSREVLEVVYVWRYG
jgi:hypothetical protein